MGNIMKCSYCGSRATVNVTITGHDVYASGNNYWTFYDKQIVVLKDMVGEKPASDIGLFTSANRRVLMHIALCRKCYDTKRTTFPSDHVVQYRTCGWLKK